MRATKGRGPRRGQHPSRGMEREIDSQWERDSEGRRGGKRETQSGMERARDSEGGGVGARLRVERERDSEWELQASKRAVIKYRMAIFLFGENQSVVTRSRTAQPHCIAALLSRAALPHCVAALRRRTGGTPIFPGRLLRLRGRGLHSPLPLTLLPYPSRPSLLSLLFSLLFDAGSAPTRAVPTRPTAACGGLCSLHGLWSASYGTVRSEGAYAAYCGVRRAA